ncbi:MAG: YHS domain-containing (seleno)protein [Planctomycetota bacterium]
MKRLLNPALIALLALSTFAVAQSALAHDASGQPDHLTLTVGVKGYSPVSYFTVGQAEPGSPLHTAEHEGVTYFLTSAEQVATFNADPAKYAPAYGGYCAFGAAVEDHFDADPKTFKIVDGRLMLFLRNAEVNALDLWNDKDEAELVQKADAFWAETHGG